MVFPPVQHFFHPDLVSGKETIILKLKRDISFFDDKGVFYYLVMGFFGFTSIY